MVTNLPYFILNQNLIHLLNKMMKLKVILVSLLTLLVALAVNPANASPIQNKKIIESTSQFQTYLIIYFKEKI